MSASQTTNSTNNLDYSFPSQVIFSSKQLHTLLGVTPQRRREYQKIMQKACKDVRSPEYEKLGFSPRQESWDSRQAQALFNFRKLYLPVDRGGLGLNDKRAYRYVKTNGIP